LSHPLLDANPLLQLLSADLRDNPGIQAADDGDPARAAVAIILTTRPQATGHRPQDLPSHESRVTRHELEVLLILRATRDGDPWSGQVALPGGRSDPTDATLQDTAIRETLEETGIDLGASGVILGALDELRPRTPVLPPIIVTPFVAVAPYDSPLTGSTEVAEAFWVPWSTFADPDLVEENMVHVRGDEWRVSSYAIGSRIVWGMTERMLRQLAVRIRSLQAP
jgi:8-oxo-dGTP pyrophosphatase MutT (NUDIX family)